MDINKVLRSLQLKRPIFHSEADFQLALAWEIQTLYPDAQIRLEYNYPFSNTNVYLDILVRYKGIVIPIELKYKTKKSTFLVQNEHYKLREHSAQDLGRYDFIKDLWIGYT